MATLVIRTIKSSGGDYSSRSAYEAANQGNLVTADEVRRGEIYAFGDTTPLYIDGSTTDATRYMEFVVATGEGHAGKWDNSKARLVDTTGWQNTVDIQDLYCRIIGDQIYRNNSDGSYNCIYTYADYVEVRNCICKATGSTNTTGITLDAGTNIRARNCLIYDCVSGITTAWATTPRVYNCSVVDCSAFGFQQSAGSGTFYLKNCLADNCTSGGFVQTAGTFNVNYCASSDATADDFGGTGNRISQTFTFVDAAGDDFHLASSDAGAKDYGTDLSGDANYPFSDDIDGQTRSGTWDIGADEYVAAGGGANWLKQGYWWEMYRGGRG